MNPDTPLRPSSDAPEEDQWCVQSTPVRVSPAPILGHRWRVAPWPAACRRCNSTTPSLMDRWRWRCSQRMSKSARAWPRSSTTARPRRSPTPSSRSRSSIAQCATTRPQRASRARLAARDARTRAGHAARLHQPASPVAERGGGTRGSTARQCRGTHPAVGRAGRAPHRGLRRASCTPAARTVVLRVAQEALRNIAKHSSATNAWLATRTRVSPDGEHRMDPRGWRRRPRLRLSRPSPHIPIDATSDLRFMRERADLLGSDLAHSDSPAGTVVRLTIDHQHEEGRGVDHDGNRLRGTGSPARRSGPAQPGATDQDPARRRPRAVPRGHAPDPRQASPTSTSSARPRTAATRSRWRSR